MTEEAVARRTPRRRDAATPPQLLASLFKIKGNHGQQSQTSVVKRIPGNSMQVPAAGPYMSVVGSRLTLCSRGIS